MQAKSPWGDRRIVTMNLSFDGTRLEQSGGPANFSSA
jgi:hypothetical protein